jgi:class 3 adenylate cyclase
LVAFRSTDKALDYAVALHNEPGAPELRVRAGIHIGSVLPDEGDVFGRSVNFAARVVGAIKHAEIWLSDEARSDLDGLGASRFERLHWERHDNIRLRSFEGAFRLWLTTPSLSSSDPIGSDEMTAPQASRAPTMRPRIINSSRAEFHAAAQN